MESYDYIIVGAGSAGCVLANRLSADPAHRVLLLEAGPEDRSPWIELPKGFAKLIPDPRHTWVYPVGQPRRNSAEANEAWIYGRGLGGSSAINGMAYVRGQPEDYEEWARLASPDWGWAQMKQAFRSIEDNELGDDGVRGVGGPLRISVGCFRYPLTERLIAAGEQVGLSRRDDLNGEDQEGIGYLSHNIWRGRRQSSSAAFLKPVRHRANLTVVTNALVDRVLFEGRRAHAVECRVDGRRTRFLTRGEVIVSAGSLQSPKLLQLSGIGPGRLLQSLGVDVVHDSPDVGRRMFDHLTLAVCHRLKGGERGLNHRFRGVGLAASVVQYFLSHTGPLAGGPMEVGAFARVESSARRPDVELMIGGTSMAPPDESGAIAADTRPGMTVYASMLRLTSEGEIRIGSADPDAPLVIQPNWLSTDYDRTLAVAALRYARRYLAQPALAPVVGEEMVPGPQVQSDEEILDMAYRSAFCGLHAIRTCRMGRDEESVVDERLRVRGVEGIRVVDCSTMPGRVSGNTNGPAMAFAWRGADLILQDARSRTVS